MSIVNFGPSAVILCACAHETTRNIHVAGREAEAEYACSLGRVTTHACVVQLHFAERCLKQFLTSLSSQNTPDGRMGKGCLCVIINCLFSEINLTSEEFSSFMSPSRELLLAEFRVTIFSSMPFTDLDTSELQHGLSLLLFHYTAFFTCNRYPQVLQMVSLRACCRIK